MIESWPWLLVIVINMHSFNMGAHPDVFTCQKLGAHTKAIFLKDERNPRSIYWVCIQAVTGKRVSG